MLSQVYIKLYALSQKGICLQNIDLLKRDGTSEVVLKKHIFTEK
jgi:hypothetical protein